MKAADYFTAKIYRSCDTLRLRKVVVEIYNDKGILLDKTRMFGVIFKTPRGLARLSAKIERRLQRRLMVCKIFDKFTA